MPEHFYKYEKSISAPKKRDLGIVYTPIDIVDTINSKMLCKWVADKPPLVLDPCCGTGVFLYDMAHKISERWSMPIEEVYEKYMYGFDVDADAVEVGRQAMRSVNLVVCDSLKQDYSKYDIIVTNPPYIRIQNLSEEQRTYIQKEFEFTGGDTDIYIAFLEKLAKTDLLVGLISPSSWARNKSASRLRNYFYECHRVQEIIDFGDRRIFSGAQTYTSILFMGNSDQLRYTRPDSSVIESLKYSDSDSESLFLGKCLDHSEGKNKELFDVCDIKVGLATLADGLFYGVCQAGETSDTVKFKNKHGEYIIERAILRKCTKASKIQNIEENTYIIYPYTKDGELIDEQTLAAEYPRAYELLTLHKDILLKRDKGKIEHKKWYGFGRTQGLRSLGPKLLLPPFQKDRIVVREITAEEMYISGYAVYPKKGHSMSRIKDILTSKELFEQIKPFAKPMSGGWIGVSKNTFKHYKF